METKGNDPVLTGKEGKEFDVETSANWTKNYREKHPDETVSHFFGKEIVQKILDQDGCMGVRIYHANDEQGKKHVIIVGADQHGNDIHPHVEKDGKMMHVSLSKSEMREVKAPEAVQTGGVVGEMSTPCPGGKGCP